MNKRWWVSLLAALALVLVCCVALVFAGASVITGRAAATCGNASLTPEEKANCGIHSYQLTEKLTSYCAIMKPDQGLRIVTTEFAGNTMTTSVRPSVYTSMGPNEFQSISGKLSTTSNINKHVHTIKFNMSGFTENYAYEGPQGNLIDCWLDTYTITR